MKRVNLMKDFSTFKNIDKNNYTSYVNKQLTGEKFPFDKKRKLLCCLKKNKRNLEKLNTN